MKILYVGGERDDARTVATALRDIVKDGSVSWASRVDHAAKWLDENRDLAAVVVEAAQIGSSWPPVLQHGQGPAPRPAVVVIVPEGTGPPFDAAPPGADGYIVKSASLSRDLPAVVARAIDRARGTAIEYTGGAELEQKLAQATKALQEAEQRHLAAMAAAAEQLAERQVKYELATTRAAATWEMVDEQLRAAALEVERARQSQTAAAAEAERLTRRESELSSRLAEAAASSNALEHRLADAEKALEAANARAERERLAAAGQLSEQQRELQAQIAQETAARRGLEERLAHAERSLDDARERHASELTDASVRSRHLEEAFRLAEQDIDAKAADLERLSKREAELASLLADSEARRGNLERRLAATEAAFQEADTRATHERLTTSRRAAEREAELDGQLRQERAARDAVERAVADGEVALRDQQERHDAALAAAAGELAGRQTHFDHELSQIGRELAQTVADRDRLTEMLSEVVASLDLLRRDHQSATADVARLSAREADLASQLAGEVAARLTLERVLGDTRAAALEAERSFREERLDHESRLAQLQAALGRQSSEHAAETSARHREIEHLQEMLAATVREVEAGTHREEALQTEADKVPHLIKERDGSRAESRRLFQQSGLAMFLCARDGALTDANRAGLALVGRRTTDELRGAHFGAAVFDDANGLSWLIERCLGTRTRESVETTWRRKDGSPVFVRLSAYAASAEVVEIVAEDLTRLRALQERLARANRMEAVGRIALEVAVTCGNVLGDVHRNMREWLTPAGGGAASRHRGERLLDEVTRAAGLLRQLAAYGDNEPAGTPAPADLTTVIRDLEPVLKRVAGHDVEVQLPDTAARLNVDVGAERIERLLVNLASCGRERMPSGGRLRIDLGTTVVDRRFASRHPNVRLGLHALITVTESRRGPRATALLQPDGGPSDIASGSAAAKRGVDFGALHGLVGECGGHLWMTIQPPGDMVAKIRLPLHASSSDQTPVRMLAARGGRDRAIARWFQH